MNCKCLDRMACSLMGKIAYTATKKPKASEKWSPTWNPTVKYDPNSSKLGP